MELPARGSGLWHHVAESDDVADPVAVPDGFSDDVADPVAVPDGFSDDVADPVADQLTHGNSHSFSDRLTDDFADQLAHGEPDDDADHLAHGEPDDVADPVAVPDGFSDGEADHPHQAEQAW